MTSTSATPTDTDTPDESLSLREKWQGLIPNYAEILAKIRAEQAALRPQVMALFGVDDDANVRAYWKIQQQEQECVGCKGAPCQKDVSKYLHVFARLVDGEIKDCYRRCEVSVRQAIKNAVKRDNLPARYANKSFSSYEVTADNDRAVKIAKCFIDSQGQRSLYFHGGCGTGKTFLAALIAKAFLKAQRQVVFADVPTLLENIKRSFDTGNTEELFRRYKQCDLLVLDDIGTGKISDWTNDVLYRLVNERYIAERPMILTGNHSLQDLQKVLSKGDEITGKRITSRLAEMCVQAYLGEVDRRFQGG